jgi:hypothetical protein
MKMRQLIVLDIGYEFGEVTVPSSWDWQQIVEKGLPAGATKLLESRHGVVREMTDKEWRQEDEVPFRGG